MPELPEVETIARQLHAALAGRVLERVIHVRADMVREATAPIEQLLAGSRIQRVTRRAKRVVFDLASAGGPSGVQSGAAGEWNTGGSLVIHLGMSGRLLMCSRDAVVEKHTHLRVVLDGGREELRFVDPRRFGGIWVLSIVHCRLAIEGADDAQVNSRATTSPRSTASSSRIGPASTPTKRRALGPLGPEPLELSARKFGELLARKRQIKALLMDQTAIAGLGNIYCDESLYAAGIHPLALANTLTPDQVARLLRAIKSVLRRAIRFAGSTLMDYRSANGEPGSFQRYHRVYNRAGKRCRRCGTAIERLMVAGRTSCFCPQCQARHVTVGKSKRRAKTVRRSRLLKSSR